MVSARSISKPLDSALTQSSTAQGRLSFEIFLISVLTLVSLTLLLMGLDWGGYISTPVAFLGSKAMVAVQGPEPSFSATGYSFPPLLVYGSALLRSPITLQVISGTVLVGLVTYAMHRVAVNRLWRSLWLILIFIHPAFGLMLLRDPTWIVASVFLFLTLQLSLQLIDSQRTYSMSFLVVMLGLLFSGLIQIRFEAWLGLLWFCLLLWCFLLEETWQYRVAALFVVLTMGLFSMGTCCYLNWLAADDPFAFLSNMGSGLRLVGLNALWVRSGFGEGLVMGLIGMLQIAPIYALISIWSIWQQQSPLRVGMMLTLPLVLLAISAWQGLYTPNLSQFGMYLTFIPLLLQNLRSLKSWRKLGITAALVVSLFSSGWVLQQNQVIPEETLLWRQLTRQNIPSVESARVLNQKMKEQREIATYLFRTRRLNQKILMDDSIHFPILYRLQSTEGLILPHQYEFYNVLEQPDKWVNYIVVAGNKSPLRLQDQVRSSLAQRTIGDPESTEALKLRNYQTVFESPDYQLLQRT